MNNDDFHFGFGPQWRGVWSSGTVERNRRIYDFELVHFASGRARVLTRDAEFDCAPGSIIIIPPGMTHCTIGTTRVERWCVHFDWYNDTPAHRLAPRIFVYETNDSEFVDGWTAKPPPGVSMPFFNPTPPDEATLLVKKFFSLGGDDGVAGRLLKNGVFGTLLGLVLADSATGDSAVAPGPGRTFLLAKGVIDARFTDPDFRVSDAAAAVGIGLNQLGKRFRKILGVPVHDYLLARRIEHAATLLRNSRLTIRETAFASGFNDPNYFARLFRRRTGIAPSEYKELPPDRPR